MWYPSSSSLKELKKVVNFLQTFLIISGFSTWSNNLTNIFIAAKTTPELECEMQGITFSIISFIVETDKNKKYILQNISDAFDINLLMKKNIVLIGMPSCGKTTVGRKLASLTSLRFVDSDEEIVKKEISYDSSNY